MLLIGKAKPVVSGEHAITNCLPHPMGDVSGGIVVSKQCIVVAGLLERADSLMLAVSNGGLKLSSLGWGRREGKLECVS